VPPQLSFALTFAPPSTSTRIASVFPVRAAIINAVSPAAERAAFGSAPALSSRSTTRALPLVHASDSGVILYRVAAFTSAPAASSISTSATSSRWTAQCSAVEPSVSGALMLLTGVFCAMSARTAAASPRFTASMSFVLAEAVDAARRSAVTTRALRMCVI